MLDCITLVENGIDITGIADAAISLKSHPEQAKDLCHLTYWS